MEDDFSAIRSLQELKNLLDAGAITQEEYDTLKKKIIFGSSEKGQMPGQPLPSSHLVQPASEETEDDDDEAYVAFDNDTRPASTYNPDAIGPDGVGEGAYLENEPERKDMLVTILITLGVLLLLGLIAYQLMSDQGSEKLASTNNPEEMVADTSKLGAASRSGTASGLVIGDSLAAPATANTPSADEALIEGNPNATTATAAVPNLSEEEIVSRAKDRLESYYDDLRNAPFSAQRHFAPVVERYHSLVNTTPAAINENVSSYHFPEFQDSEASIEEGSMKVSTIPQGYEATYIELGTAFRKSKNQKQQTKARVRARFDADFKMTYFRQEALLENNFVE